jgi:pimeloyl-ACP methyl ester carboxylesterase
MTPVVLVHGGGLDARCWERMLPLLAGPAIAVDLPGRGAHPAALDTVTLADCAASVADDVDGAGFDEIVLVGHSLAGCTMPGIVALLGDRVRHAVFVACTVPEDGTTCFDTLDAAVQARGRDAADDAAHDAARREPSGMDADMAELVLGIDLTDEQFAWCVERLVPEATGITTEPVDLAPFGAHPSMGRTWIRTLGDLIVAPEKQVRFARNVGDCAVVDVAAGHMCMVGRPEETAAIIDRVAA